MLPELSLTNWHADWPLKRPVLNLHWTANGLKSRSVSSIYELQGQIEHDIEGALDVPLDKRKPI